MNNIKNDLNTGEYKRVYLLYGDENYLKKAYTDKIRKKVIAPDDNMNLTLISGENFDAKEFMGICDTMPFFADRRLVIVNRSGKFKTAGKNADEGGDKAKEKSSDPLCDYMKQIPDTTVVIFVEDEVDKRSRLFKAVKEAGYACEMGYMNPQDLSKWIALEFKNSGKRITYETAFHLIDRCGTDMENLKIEIEKLSFYAMDRDTVEKTDIDDICVRQLSADIFALTDSLAAGNRAGALKIYNELLSKKTAVALIWRMLNKHFMQLLIAKEMKAAGKTKDDLASALSMHPYPAKKLMDQVGAFKTRTLREKVEYGVQLEQDMKSGRIDEDNIVELFIIKNTCN